jgi:hypothetical protein
MAQNRRAHLHPVLRINTAKSTPREIAKKRRDGDHIHPAVIAAAAIQDGGEKTGRSTRREANPKSEEVKRKSLTRKKVVRNQSTQITRHHLMGRMVQM